MLVRSVEGRQEEISDCFEILCLFCFVCVVATAKLCAIKVWFGVMCMNWCGYSSVSIF